MRSSSFLRGLFAALVTIPLSACHGDPPPIAFGPRGPIAGATGRGSFTFGVATAGTQIEEGVTQSDWYYWTAPAASGGLGRGTFVGNAVGGYAQALSDVQLIADTGVDAYRFNIPWARIEPVRDQIDETALAHYDVLIDALVVANIKPMITVHHFSSPIWVDDFRSPDPCVPSSTDLCGWDDDAGAAQIAQELADFAALLAQRFGDRVDEWGTLNEPVNYLLASYGAGQFPPGKSLLLNGDGSGFLRAVRNYIAAHAAVYDAIKANDHIDADGDGEPAFVGLSLNSIDWIPTRLSSPSDFPEDVAAADKMFYAYHYLIPDSVREGRFDAQIDQDPSNDEPHPEWGARLDWLGVQYYSRGGATAQVAISPLLGVTPCLPGNDLFKVCIPPADPSHCVPEMQYEYYEPGLYRALSSLGARYPDLPLTVTESGIATLSGDRRAEHIVRSLEQIERALASGVDVRGYYHWSLMDNFEWLLGFAPKFGLYSVDTTTYERTTTLGQLVLSDIATTRRVTSAFRSRYGGLGPMSAEPVPASGAPWDIETCTKY